MSAAQVGELALYGVWVSQERPAARPPAPLRARPSTPASRTSAARPRPTAPAPPPAPAGSSRDELPAVGAALTVLIITLLGGVADVILTRSFGSIFSISFVIACLAGALLVRRDDLVFAMIAPPIVFVVVVLVAAQFLPHPSGSSWVKRQIFDLVTTMALDAPYLVGGTALAGVVVAFRWWSSRRG